MRPAQGRSAWALRLDGSHSFARWRTDAQREAEGGRRPAPSSRRLVAAGV